MPDEALLDLSRLSADPLYTMESCLRIIPKSGRGLVPFKLNREQIEVLGIIWKAWKAGEPVRIIILKARQLGMSTLIEAFLYWLTSTHDHITALILGHEREASMNILRMAQRFSTYDARHDVGAMPEMSNLNKNELNFDNPDWRTRAEKPGLDSRIKIATADNRSAGHSSTLQAFHGTEVARWKRPEILNGVLNALAFGAETIGVLESTAHGASGIFWDVWQASAKGQNEWTPIFLPWRGRPEYRRKIPAGYTFEPTPYEEKIGKEHELTTEELYWRRLIIASPACQGQGIPPEDVFREQYPLTPEEAFVSSGKNYFDMASILTLEAVARQVPFKVGHIVAARPTKRGKMGLSEFVPDNGGMLRVWKPPQDGHDYVIGADVAAGIRGCDFSVAYVMDRVTREYVARYRAIVDPKRFTVDLVALGTWYNQAFLAAEANSIGSVVARGIADDYVRCCYHVSLESTEREFDTDRPGWYTTATNRKQMFAEMRQALLDRAVTVWCEDFLAEAHHFIVPEGVDGQNREGTPRAEKRQHDDCIMAGTIAFWVNQTEIAGSIRRPKDVAELPPTARHAAMREDAKGERGESARRAQELYDEHLGDW